MLLNHGIFVSGGPKFTLMDIARFLCAVFDVIIVSSWSIKLEWCGVSVNHACS